jgi:colanic acid biosynthesis glycosyl transferase WcaI
VTGPRRQLIWLEEQGLLHVIRTAAIAVSKQRFALRTIGYFLYNCLSAIALVRRPADIVLIDAPAFVAGLAALTCIIRTVPYVYVVHDLYPDALVQGKAGFPKALVAVAGALELSVMRRASAISVLTEGLRREIAARAPERPVTVIPVSIDTERIRPYERPSSFRKQWEVEDSFVVLYAGNIGLHQALDHVIEAARLIENIPGVIFCFVGEGAQRPALETLSAGLRNVRWFSFVPDSEYPELLAAADVGLVSLDPSIEHTSVPSKAYSIMAAGRPVLAYVSRQNELTQLVNRNDCGVAVTSGKPSELAEAILSLQGSPATVARLGRRARETAVTRYSRAFGAQQYADLVNSVLRSSRRPSFQGEEDDAR